MFSEASLEDLYLSAVKAFPGTTKRQHAVDPVVIKKLHWTPFLGLNTLFVKGQAQNEGREYDTIVLFKKVNYKGNKVTIVANDGKEYSFDPLSLEETDCQVRCSCPDFRYRFNYYDHLDKSLYGRKAPAYESKGIGPPANPMEYPGMCKHLMKTAKALLEAGVLK